ncbi:MAG TPA: protein translocase subunit SecD [Planctomycetota bacterium]
MVPNLSRKVFGILLLIALTAYSLFAFQINLGLDLLGGSRLVYRLDFDKAEEEGLVSANENRQGLIQDTATVFLRRLDSTGLADISIYPQGDDRVVVEIPKRGEDEVETIKRTIVNQGSLLFRIVVNDSDDLNRQQEIDKFRTWRTANPGVLAHEFNRIAEKDGGPRRGVAWYSPSENVLKEPNLVATFEAAPGLGAAMVRVESELRGTPEQPDNSWDFSGAGLKSVGPSSDTRTGFPAVRFEFIEARKTDFANFTDEYKNRLMAIVLNNRVDSAPSINQRLPGEGIITGGMDGFAPEEVRELITVLRTGSLKIAPELESESFVGPSLGAESVRIGVLSAAIGGLLVLLFMLLYYRTNGLVGCAALVFNAAILLGAMAFTQATLTLPGIAGLVLTIGMAVDANILIFERVREERQRGRDVAQAYKNGYEKALSAIVDSNLTTLITALVLFRVGTGPVRGFAATLSLGIITSMFSALVFSKVLMHVLVFSKPARITEVKMAGRIIDEPKYDFLGKRKIAIGTSIVLVAAGLVAALSVGKDMLGIDFVGGGSARINLAQQASTGDVATRLGTGYSVVRMESRAAAVDETSSDTFLVKKKFSSAEEGSNDMAFFESELTSRLDGLLAVENPFPEINTVGLRVSGDIQQKAIQAILLSMIAIVIYLNFRFKELRYGLAAVTAVFHDVLFTLGALAAAHMAGLMEMEVNLEIIAAFLTIIGYSLNDTIVIFDRIRENLPRKQGTYSEIVNLSINQSLSRTILTSLTTFFVVAVLFFVNSSQHNVLAAFAFAMLIGVVVGTYSTMFIASPMLMFLDRWSHKRGGTSAASAQGGKGQRKGSTAPAGA